MRYFKYYLILCSFLLGCKKGKNEEINHNYDEFIHVDEAKADLDSLLVSIESIHYNAFFKNTEESIYRTKDSLIALWHKDSISYKTFIVSAMKLTAMMSNGHTAVDWQHDKLISAFTNHKFLPLKVKRNAKNEIEIIESAIHNPAQGRVINRINGVAIDKIYKEALSLHGGIANFKAAYVSDFFPISLFLLGVKSPYTIEFDDANTIDDYLGIDFNAIQNFLNPNKEVLEPYSFKTQNDIGIINYNLCEDLNGFKVFLKNTFESISKQKIKTVIIDIRKNPGGNSALNDELLSYITKKPYRQFSGRYWKMSQLLKEEIREGVWNEFLSKSFIDTLLRTPNGVKYKDFDEVLTKPKSNAFFFEGKVFLLIGPETFSSANFLADAVKTYDIATLIGQPTGELTNDFGEQVFFTLPNSKLNFYVPTTYDIGADGKEDKVSAVIPDVYVNGDALEYAIKLFSSE